MQIRRGGRSLPVEMSTTYAQTPLACPPVLLKPHTASINNSDKCAPKNTKVDIRRRGRRLRITRFVVVSHYLAAFLPSVRADTFLQINDQINTVLNRYEAFKKGDYSFSSNPIPAELGGGTSAGGGLSLIDFDDSAPTNGGSGSAKPDDDLAGLFGSAPTAPPQQSAPPIVNTSTKPTFPSQSPPSQQPQFGSIMLPGTPKPGSAETSRVASPNYLNRGNGNGVGMGMGMSAGMSMGAMTPQARQQQPAAPAPQPTTNRSQSKDPFADLAGLF